VSQVLPGKEQLLFFTLFNHHIVFPQQRQKIAFDDRSGFAFAISQIL